MKDKDKNNTKNERKKLKEFHFYLTIPLLLVDLAINAAMMSKDKAFHSIASITLIVTIFCFSFIIIESFRKIGPEFTSFIAMPIFLNLTALLMYLVLADYWKPEQMITKILIFLNFFIVEGIMIYRRLLRKDKKYIDSLKSGENGKYSKSDIKLSAIIAILIMIIAKMFDKNSIIFYHQQLSDYVLAVIGVVLPAIGIAGCVTGFATYLYRKK